MPLKQTDVVVVGGGQAGIAASEHLTKAGIKHIVLERARTPKIGVLCVGTHLLRMVQHGMIDFPI